MIKYKLLNFDLGESPRFNNFLVGPYQITLSKSYNKIRLKLVKGINVVTAIAKCRDEEEKAVLTYNPNEKGVWDLCYILSFLLGRMFSFPGHEFHFIHRKSCEKIFEIDQIPNAANIAWNNRFKLKEEKRPLWYYLGIIDTPIIQYQALYGCIALEIIFRDIEIEIPAELNKLTDDVKNIINHGLPNGKLKSELMGNLGHWGKSYTSKLKQLLINWGVVLDNISEIAENRIKTITKIRNDIAHGNKIEYPKWLDGNEEDKKREYIFISTVFIPSLVKEFLCRSFGLNDFYLVIRNRECLQEYIYNGTWGELPIKDIIF